MIQDRDRHRVTAAGCPDDVGGTGRLQPPQQAGRFEPGRLAGRSRDPCSAGDGLHAATVAAGAQRTSRLDHNVPHLARDPMRPAVQLAVQDQAGADAGGDGDIDEVARAPGSATHRLTERGEVRVVMEEASDPGRLGQDAVERDVDEARKVRRADHDAGTRIDRSW